MGTATGVPSGRLARTSAHAWASDITRGDAVAAATGDASGEEGTPAPEQAATSATDMTSRHEPRISRIERRYEPGMGKPLGTSRPPAYTVTASVLRHSAAVLTRGSGEKIRKRSDAAIPAHPTAMAPRTPIPSAIAAAASAPIG